MLEGIKKYLRVTSNAFDNEITDLINACKKDLEVSGIASSSIDESDALIKRAITIYCKAHFGFDNPDYDKLLLAYELLKQHLCLVVDYITESEVSL